MEISVEKIVPFIKDSDYYYEAYNVRVENHRILTIVTYCEVTVTKWIKDAKKAYNSKSLHKTVIVSLSADRATEEYYSRRGGVRDARHHLLHLCIGSHCLLYHLPDPEEFDCLPQKFLDQFLSDPNVVVVGMGIKEKASKLEKDFGIKMKNVVDLNELAVKGMKREDLDLGRYDLDRLAKAVLGKRVDVVRPDEKKKKIEWYVNNEKPSYWCFPELKEEKVLFTTVDAYLCFLIGSELFDMIQAGSSKKMKKEIKKKK